MAFIKIEDIIIDTQNIAACKRYMTSEDDYSYQRWAIDIFLKKDSHEANGKIHIRFDGNDPGQLRPRERSEHCYQALLEVLKNENPVRSIP